MCLDPLPVCLLQIRNGVAASQRDGIHFQMRAYHLLPMNWGLAAIRNKRIKISRFADLNDPFELLGANLRYKSERLAFHRWKSQISQLYGLLCFSKTWSNPLLWSHYGQRHCGLCLGFDLPDETVVPVTYQDSRIEVDIDALNEDTILRFLSSKFSDWSYEEEVRIITDLSELDQQDKNYYANFGKELVLREVIVGALSEVSRNSVETEIGKAGLDLSQIKLLKARLAFKSFAVVTDKRGLR